MSNSIQKILIVEDNLQDFLIFREVLFQISEFSAELENATDLKMAIEMLSKGDYDVLFLDLFLPDIHGKDTFLAIKKVFPDIPTIILSGMSESSVALEIVKAGAQDYLVKGEYNATLLDKSMKYAIERKLIQQRLVSSEKRYRSTVESVGITIVEYDYSEMEETFNALKTKYKTLDEALEAKVTSLMDLRQTMKVLNINRAGLGLYGFDPGESWDDFVNQMYLPETWEAFKKLLEAVWNEDINFLELYCPILTTEGAKLHTLDRITFVGKDEGYSRMIISSADITKLKRAEEELKNRSDLIQYISKSATYLLANTNYSESMDLLLDKTKEAFKADSIVLAEKHGDGSELSFQITKNTGDSESRGVGKVFKFPDFLSDQLQNGLPLVESATIFENECEMNLPNGTIALVPILVQSYLQDVIIITHNEGKKWEEFEIKSVFTLAGNLNSYKEKLFAEDQLKLMNENLESMVVDRTSQMRDAIKELESFSYSISHDLRAPLRAIGGFSEVLSEEYSDQMDDKGKHYLKIIRNGAREMSSLIDDLLDFSRMSRKQLQYSEVKMEDLSKEIISKLISQAGDQKINIKMSPLPNCKGDNSMIGQVLTNLFWNAIKFSGNEEATNISMECVDMGEFLRYSVEDNGVGFNMDYADKIFGVFQRLHPNEEFEGTGVGLAIVQRIVAKHGGRVWAQGEEGKGAKFYFTLPKVGTKVTPVSESIEVL